MSKLGKKEIKSPFYLVYNEIKTNNQDKGFSLKEKNLENPVNYLYIDNQLNSTISWFKETYVNNFGYEKIQKIGIQGPLGTQSVIIPNYFNIKSLLPSNKDLTDSRSGSKNSYIENYNLIISIIKDNPAKNALLDKTSPRKVAMSDNNYNIHNKKFKAKVLWGTLNALLNHMYIGVTSGFTKYIKLTGIGYKFSIDNSNGILSLSIGFSHIINIKIPENIIIDSVSNNQSLCKVRSNSLTDLNKFLYTIHKLRPANRSYKGTGITIIP